MTTCITGGGTNRSPCDSGNNIAINNFPVPTGTNFFVNPSFANTADLLANWTGVPNCSGFINTTRCMGYSPATGTLTPNTPIADLRAGCAQCAGKGFQLPSTTCAANADYPTWLKGVVYLQASGWVNGAIITQKGDLVTKPCGM